MKTLALRLERQQQNARELIEFLSERPEVEKIFYAGSSSEEQTEVQSRQARGIGSVFRCCSRTAATRRPSPALCPSS